MLCMYIKKKQDHHIFGHHVFATYMVLKNLIYRPARPRSSPLFSSEKFAFVLSPPRAVASLFRDVVSLPQPPVDRVAPP